MPESKKQRAHLSSNHHHHEECMEKRLWSVFFTISLGCFFSGILIILIYRILIRVTVYLKDKKSANSESHHSTVCTNLPDWNKDEKEYHLLVKDSRRDKIDGVSRINSTIMEKFDQQHNNKHVSTRCSKWWTTVQLIFVQGRCLAIRLVSYDWIPGRIFIALSMIFSLMSFSIYAYEATIWPSEIEKCGHKGRRFRTLDFSMNIFFLIHFIVRLIASSDALLFWIEWYSILDYLTVPPTIIGFFMKRSWIGFRFVRIFRLCNLPEVLNNLNVIKSASSLRMCQLCTLFISIWFAGAGCFNLFENTGNLFGPNAYNVSQPLPYTASLYFTIVTMSTVGYGDIVPQTHLGRVFISLFILFALATFASAIPEIVDMFFNVSKYSGVYQKPEGKSHIVVCGEITTDSVRTFLNDFLHEDRQRSDVEVVFINRSKPDLQLENLLRLHFLRVKYFRGTVMDHADLQRVRMKSADACLILASATTTDPYQTDAANIMRVIAVKNFASHVRVIVQLLQTENKAYLLNSPYWNWDGGDEIICFSELKLGFLAQSCIAPGFSTLVTNLFTMHSIRGLKEAAKFTKIYMNQQNLKNSIIKSSLSLNEIVSSSSPNVIMRKSKVSTKITPENHHHHHHYSTFPLFERKNRKTQWLNKLSKMITSLFKTQEDNNSRPYSLQYPIQSTASPITLDTESSIDNYHNDIHTVLNSDNWVYNYLCGASMEIYSAKFSMAFDGLQFTEAAVICRKYLNLLLIAVVAEVLDSRDSQLVNRISGDFTSSNEIGFNSSDHNDTIVFDDDDDDDDDDKKEDEDGNVNDDDYEDEDFNESKYYLAVSPTLDKNVIINYGTVGFFICGSQENANKVSFYCLTCHLVNTSNIQSPISNIQPCSCHIKSQKSTLKLRKSGFFKTKRESFFPINCYKSDKQTPNNYLKVCSIIPELKESENTLINKTELSTTTIEQQHINSSTPSNKYFIESNCKNRILSRRNSLLSAYDTEEHYSQATEKEPRRTSDPHIESRISVISPTNDFDITGMYYYCSQQKFEDNLITSNTSINKSNDLYNHILVCILAESDAPLLGLHSFVMPLRASNFHSSQLRTILFLGDIKFLQREWLNIANFPKVYTLAGSALSRADLRKARIQYSSVCVILGSRGTIKVDDPYMLDKEVILCTLNIRAMKFSSFYRHNAFSHNIKRRNGSEIPLITELMTDNNIHYLDPDNSGGVQITASLTAPFARGIAFTSSVLDVLASTAYFDRNSMTLIRHLVTGGVTPALEQWLAEGGGLIGLHDWHDKGNHSLSKKIRSTRVSFLFPGLLKTRQRPRIEQIPLSDPRLIQMSTDGRKVFFSCYGDLFCHAIREHGILCVGIYRLSFNTLNEPNRLVTVPSKIKLNIISGEESTEVTESTASEKTGKVYDNQNFITKKFETSHRRLSTCALPVDRLLRKHSLQLNRKSLSSEDNSQQVTDPNNHHQQQQQKHHPDEQNSREKSQHIPQHTYLQMVNQHFHSDGLSRYVISNPSNHFQLYRSDLIFCLCPFES